MYQPMFGGLDEQKQNLVKRLAGRRSGGAGAARISNPYGFQSTARRGFSGLAHAARNAPFEGFTDAPGNPGLGAAHAAQQALTSPGLGGGAPQGLQSQQAPVAGVGPGAAAPGAPGSPQGGPTAGSLPDYSQAQSSSPWHLLQGGSASAQPAVPGWVQQQMGTETYSQALAAWLAANPWFGGGGGGYGGGGGTIL